MALVPAIPYGHGTPVTRPVHLEMAQGAVLEYLHTVGLDRYLGVGTTGPGAELLLGIFFSYDHDEQGLSGPEIAYGHLV